VYYRHVFFKKPPNLKERYIKGKRHYENPNGHLLPSVTTSLAMMSKEGIDAWKRRVGEAEAKKVFEFAGKTGTEMHSICENYLNNEPLQHEKYHPRAYTLFNQLKPELHKINNIMCQEVQLYSDTLRVAGRVDVVAEYDGVLSVIDFKSSRKRKTPSMIKQYQLQATCYAMMFEEMTKTKIDQICILITADDESVTPFIYDKEQFIQPLKNVIEDYHLRHEFEIPN
jgi:hypothetical protein